MPRPPLPLVLGALALFALPLPASEKPPAPDAWQTALTFDYNTAAERFATLHAVHPADTRVAIGYASSLLVKQPRTASNIETAHAILLQVVGTTPVSSAAPSSPAPLTSLTPPAAQSSPANDDAVTALFLAARVELDHLDPAQPDAARAHFEQLRREHPGHPLADQAAIELAYLATYTPSGGANPAAIPAVEALLASVKSPGAARDLHSLLAGLYLRPLNQPAAALPHFIAARAIGYEQPLSDAGLDLTIANLARETGDPSLARRHYTAFLAAAPRDGRASTVRRLLADLDSPVTAASAPTAMSAASVTPASAAR